MQSNKMDFEYFRKFGTLKIAPGKVILKKRNPRELDFFLRTRFLKTINFIRKSYISMNKTIIECLL